MPKDNKSCAERLPEHLHNRLADFDELTMLAALYDDELTPEQRAAAERQDIDVGPDERGTERAADAIAEDAQQRLYEYPLGVSTFTVHRIELSTGGPADYLDVFVSDGDIDKIVYHFADWYDHAERTLDGGDFETAASFAHYVLALDA